MNTVLDYNRLAQDYARNRRAHPVVLQELLAACRELGDGRLLEVGCGTGNYIIPLVETTSCTGWGLDPSREMLATARARSGRVHWRQGTGEALPFPDDFFELIYSVDVIHHIQGRADYFAEAQRVLKPGGHICTVTDSEEIIRQREPLSTFFPETVEIELQRYPSIALLRQLMQEAGFIDLEEKTVEFQYKIADLTPFEGKAFSSLHLISQQAYAQGLSRMREHLSREPIPANSRYVMLWGQSI